MRTACGWDDQGKAELPVGGWVGGSGLVELKFLREKPIASCPVESLRRAWESTGVCDTKCMAMWA